jgi:hypothetical protein
MSKGYRKRRTRKQTVKSARKQAKLGYGETNKNINTLRKLEQAKEEERNTNINLLLTNNLVCLLLNS